jgi:hypothetical protein
VDAGHVATDLIYGWANAPTKVGHEPQVNPLATMVPPLAI